MSHVLTRGAERFLSRWEVPDKSLKLDVLAGAFTFQQSFLKASG